MWWIYHEDLQYECDALWMDDLCEIYCSILRWNSKKNHKILIFHNKMAEITYMHNIFYSKLLLYLVLQPMHLLNNSFGHLQKFHLLPIFASTVFSVSEVSWYKNVNKSYTSAIDMYVLYLNVLITFAAASTFFVSIKASQSCKHHWNFDAL